MAALSFFSLGVDASRVPLVGRRAFVAPSVATVLAPPRPASLDTSTLAQGATSVVVVVTGTGFQSGMTAALGTGITVGSVIVSGSTVAALSLSAASDALPGPRALVLTNPDGQVGVLTTALTIPAPAPEEGGGGSAVEGDSGYSLRPEADMRLFIPYDAPGRPGLVLVTAQEVSAAGGPAGPRLTTTAEWEPAEQGGQRGVLITSVPGLAPATRYSLSVTVLSE